MTEPDSKQPPIEWFAGGEIDPRKFSEYLLSPYHPQGKHKYRLWNAIFEFVPADGPVLGDLIRSQLHQGTPEEQTPVVDPETGEEVTRWEIVIPAFRSPTGKVGPVLTGWALSPGAERPHMTTARPLRGPPAS